MEKKILEGKKILFFSPAFFGYEKRISDKMVSLGAEVHYYNERPIETSLQKAFLKVNPNIFSRMTEEYFFSILKEVENIEFDFIFFLKCEMPTKKILSKFKEKFSNSVFCLYMWDSISNVIGIEEKFPFFDNIYSFDLEDSTKYECIKFRPLFFSDEYRVTPNQYSKKYSLSFIGTIHSDRYRIIRQVKNIVDGYKLNSYFYNFLQSKFIFYYYKIIKKEFRDALISDFSFDHLSSKEIADIINETEVVLDIQHPKQSGLTMRTIEMIGMNKKIITTNPMIRQYDFYNPNNILIIDRFDVEIDLSFFESPYQELQTEIYEKYSLEKWILDILNKDNL
ncbi:capsular biosynthesis protein CpsH [Streptococcus suis]|nr:capsular biosynthesis protein CpsH [Streptococcus suis]